MSAITGGGGGGWWLRTLGSVCLAIVRPHPMQQQSANEIKEKLLQALDRDYNVVDMALAMEVISLLEKTAVTKEALETTRIGRLVNEMRKRTKNDVLARRAKDLVRRWRDMIAKPSENGGAVMSAAPQAPCHRQSSKSSPVRNVFESATSPAAMIVMTTNTSPAFRGIASSAAAAVTALQSPALVTHYQRKPIMSPSNSVASNASTSPVCSLSQTHSNSSRPSTPSSLVARSKAVSPGPGRPTSQEASHFTTTQRQSNIPQRGFKRLRDNEETMTGFEVADKKSRNGVAPDWGWADECSRDSNLSWSGDSSRFLAASGVGAGAANNAILAGASEDRSLSSSSTTRTASRLQRSTPNPAAKKQQESFKSEAPGSGDLLKEKFASIARSSKVKTTQELVQVLVRRSGSPTGKGELSSPSVASAQASCGDVERSWHDAKQEILAKFFQSQPKSVGGGGGGGAATPARVADAARDCVAEILGRLPPLDAADAVPGGILDVDQDAEYAVDDEEPAPHRPKVTAEEIDRLHSGPVDFVSGSRDFRNDFYEWHETLSVSSYQGELLHLLPYVVIE